MGAKSKQKLMTAFTYTLKKDPTSSSDDEIVDTKKSKKKQAKDSINGVSLHEYAPTNICRRTRHTRNIRKRHKKQIRKEYDNLQKERVIKNGQIIEVVCLD